MRCFLTGTIKMPFPDSAIDQDTLGPDYVKISAGEKSDGDWSFLRFISLHYFFRKYIL